MSTVNKQTSKPQPVPVKKAAPSIKAVKSNVPRGNQVFMFNRDNYMWMIAGVALILIGFALMSGGKSLNPHEFHYDEIYSFRRITVAPIVMLIGFAIEVYAIMKRPKEEQTIA